MTIYPLLVKAYAVNIYRYGNRIFETIPVDYHEHVKKYAAKNLSLSEIDEALAKGYITEQEYSETLSRVPKENEDVEQ